MSERRGARWPNLPRWLNAICGIFLLVAGIAIVAAVLESSAQGGYHPERYVGRFDPVRAAALVLLLPGPVVMAVFTSIAIVRFRARPGRAELADLVASVGFLIVTVGLAALVIWFPLTSGPLAVPPAILWTIFIGAAVWMIGFLPVLAAAVIAAVRRGDRAVLVAVACITAWIVIAIVRRG